MTRTLRSALFWLSVLMAVVAAPTLLRAQELTLQEAKQHGWIGEQSDGYLGLVTQVAPAAARDLVKRINARRTDIYAGIAKQEGISVVAVAARSGQRLIGESAPGEWVWENGGWHQRVP